ncbi:hypothetical protein HDU96_002157, partial [Phlyctochytrium bullatum]
MAVIELRWVDTSTDANLGDANAEFVFTAFTKAIWRKPDRETTATRIDSPPAAKPDILREEEAAREASRISGSYQLVNGLRDLPDTNRFNSTLMLQGSEEEKRQDLFNTTSTLYMNVKTPFTAMGREEVEAEDQKKPRLFSAGANIEAKGEWRPSPSFMDPDGGKDCSVREVLAEDFEMLPNMPFIAYQHHGLVKVKFIDQIANGSRFDLSSLKLIVLATAKIFWSIANLDNMDKDLVKWSTECKGYLNTSQEAQADDGKSLGLVYAEANAFVSKQGPQNKTEELRLLEAISKVVENPPMSLEQAKENPPATSCRNVEFTEVTKSNEDVSWSADNQSKKTIKVEIALTTSESNVVDLLFQERMLCGIVRSLKRKGLSVFHIIRNAIDSSFTFAQVEESTEVPEVAEIGEDAVSALDDDSLQTPEIILSAADKAKSEFLSDLEAAAKGCRAIDWTLLQGSSPLPVPDDKSKKPKKAKTIKDIWKSVFTDLLYVLETPFRILAAALWMDKTNLNAVATTGRTEVLADIKSEITKHGNAEKALKRYALALEDGTHVCVNPPSEPRKYIPMQAKSQLTFFVVESVVRNVPQLFKISLNETIRVGDSRVITVPGVSDTRLEVALCRRIKPSPKEAGIG